MSPASFRLHFFVVLHAATPALHSLRVPVPLAKNFGIGQIRSAAAELRAAWQAKPESRFALLAAEPCVAGSSTTSISQSQCLRSFCGSPAPPPPGGVRFVRVARL